MHRHHLYGQAQLPTSGHQRTRAGASCACPRRWARARPCIGRGVRRCGRGGCTRGRGIRVCACACGYWWVMWSDWLTDCVRTILCPSGIVRASAKGKAGGGPHPPVATVVRSTCTPIYHTNVTTHNPPPFNPPKQQARAYGGLAWVLNPCRVSYEVVDVQDNDGDGGGHARWSAVAYATTGRHLIAGACSGRGGGGVWWDISARRLRKAERVCE